MTEDVNLAAPPPGPTITPEMREAGRDAMAAAGLFATRADAEAVYRAMWLARPPGCAVGGV